MQEQFSFPFLPPHRPPKHNLFFAILPDDEAKKRIAELVVGLRNEYGLTGRPMEPERLHVSLHSLGAYVDLPHRIIAVGKKVGSAVGGRSFQITFDSVVSFGTSRPAPLVFTSTSELTGLVSFWRLLGAETDKVLRRDRVPSGFTPHLTLLYDDHVIGELSVRPIVWTAREFVLVQSLYGQRRYVQLARWRLRD